MNGGSYTQHLQLLAKAVRTGRGRHAGRDAAAMITLLAILLTKKHPQVETLPARNLTQEKPAIKVVKLRTAHKLFILTTQKSW
jgi:hypothetical protein